MMFSTYLRYLLFPLFLVFLAGCSSSDDDDDNFTDPNPGPVEPQYTFDEVDDRFQLFLDESEVFDGISYVIVDTQQGEVHREVFGDHSEDLIVMLASTSKVPVATLLMALDGDEAIDYDVEAPIGQYLPWEGLFGDRTSAQLVSNTSGLPGLEGLADYGAHACQFLFVGTLDSCARTIYTTPLPGTVDAGTTFSYGGSQWQLAGAVAENVSNSSWNQAFQDYIGEACELEVFEFGNMWSDLSQWTGTPDSLLGRDNPNIEGGAISNLDDYAKLLLLHLRDGRCGDIQVMPEGAAAFMREDRGGEFGTPYGMGWWIQANDDASAPTVFYDPGAFGAISWIDIERGIGGYVAIDDYTRVDSGAPIALVLAEIIPLVAEAVDAARAEAAQ